MASIDHITIDFLRECFTPDLAAGVLYWNERPLSHFANRAAAATFNSQRAGKPNSSIRGGYAYVRIKRNILVHRILYAFSKGIDLGEVPAIIDHVDGNILNNSIDNLRPATPRQSSRNRGLMSTNTTGLIGASFCKRHQKWRAKINNGDIEIHLGYFSTKEEAGAAYRGAAIILHGEFFRDGQGFGSP